MRESGSGHAEPGAAAAGAARVIERVGRRRRADRARAGHLEVVRRAALDAARGDAVHGRGVIDSAIGDGVLDDTSLAYNISNAEGQTYRFSVIIDRVENTWTLKVDGNNLVLNAPLNTDANAAGFLENPGWFSTLVSSGAEMELQQSEIGGGAFIIDDILIFEASEPTAVYNFTIH